MRRTIYINIIRRTLLTLCLMATATMAWAAEVTNAAQLEEALAGMDGTITLTSNITLSKTLTINRAVTLNLNGHLISANGFRAFEITQGEFVAVMGPSGCGKTTLINILGGLLEPTNGEVLLDGKPVKGPGPDRGMVFQGYSLFPWLTVQKNVEFGLKMKKIPTDRIALK